MIASLVDLEVIEVGFVGSIRVSLEFWVFWWIACVMSLELWIWRLLVVGKSLFLGVARWRCGLCRGKFME